MKTLACVLCLSFLSGCSALGALGISSKDLLPTLQYCHEVSYTRVGTEMIMQAKCRVPAG